MYRSNGANTASFLRDLGSLAMGSCSCIMVGDFNIDLLQDSNNSIVRTITSNGFVQHVEFPTHIEGGLLDHVYVRKPTSRIVISSYAPFYSDHQALSIVKTIADD